MYSDKLKVPRVDSSGILVGCSRLLVISMWFSWVPEEACSFFAYAILTVWTF